MTPTDSRDLAVPRGLDRLQTVGLVAGLAGTAACAVGFATAPQAALAAWLVGTIFWLGIALGCLAFLMIHHLTGGAWGVVVRRLFEAGARTLPLLLVLMLPLLFGLPHLYRWARPEAAEDALLVHKAPYLNEGAFQGRFVLYFAVWLGLAYLLLRLSSAQDKTGDTGLLRRMRVVSAPGLVLWAFTVSFAVFDWIMSLQPEWFSTIYGVYYFGGFGLATLSFLIPVAARLKAEEPLGRYLELKHFHDYGKLMLAFVMLWAYFAFSQFLIIWAGNQPEEIEWYLHRLHGGWQAVALALVFFRFAIPFSLLLSRDLKMNLKAISALGVAMLAVCWLDLYWQVAPVFHPEGFAIGWLDVAAPLGVGGLWCCAFVWLLKRRPAVPVRDPFLTPRAEEAAAHG